MTQDTIKQGTSKQDTFNKVNLTLSVLALIVAGSSAFVSIATYKAGLEDVDVQCHPYLGKFETVLKDTDSNLEPDVIIMPFRGVITNHSDRPVVVRALDVFHVNDLSTDEDPVESDSSCILCRVDEDPPFTIKPSDVAIVQLRIAMPLDQRAANVLSDTVQLGREYDLQDLRQQLYQRNMDFFGNLVEDGKKPEIAKNDEFRIEITTSREHKFGEKFCWYECQ